MIGMEVAGLRIRIDNRYARTKEYCEGFLTVPEGSDWDMEIAVTEGDIDEEGARSVDKRFSRGYLETVCLLRMIANRLSSFDAFLMHAATVAVDGKAYAFLAPSGTGKSTHVGLWQSLLGEKMAYVNGDKPFVRLIDGVFCACGNPWRGKEGYGDGRIAPLGGICILHRGAENAIRRLSAREASDAFLRQVHLPPDPTMAIGTLMLADAVLQSTPLWELYCNISPEAAVLSYTHMSGVHREKGEGKEPKEGNHL